MELAALQFGSVRPHLAGHGSRRLTPSGDLQNFQADSLLPLPLGRILILLPFSPSPPPREERAGERRRNCSQINSPLPSPLPAWAGRGSRSQAAPLPLCASPTRLWRNPLPLRTPPEAVSKNPAGVQLLPESGLQNPGWLWRNPLALLQNPQPVQPPPEPVLPSPVSLLQNPPALWQSRNTLYYSHLRLDWRLLTSRSERRAGLRPACPIPKGLSRPAQGCEERATLGNPKRSIPNPIGVVAKIAVAGYNPVGVGTSARCVPRVARSSQPWAWSRNPLGIRTHGSAKNLRTVPSTINN